MESAVKQLFHIWFMFFDCPPEPVPAPFFPQRFLGNSCASFLQLSSVSTQEAAYAIVKDDERDELSFPLRLSQTFGGRGKRKERLI